MGKQRTSHERHRDAQIITEWRLQDPPVTWQEIRKRISEMYGRQISLSAIWETYYETRDNASKEFKEKRLSELYATTMWAIQEAADAWEASKGRVVKKTVRIKPPGKKPKNEDEQTEKNALEIVTYEEVSHGDPAYLNTVKSYLERLAKLTGGDAPVKVAKTDTDGNSIDETPTIVILPSNGREKAGGDNA